MQLHRENWTKKAPLSSPETKVLNGRTPKTLPMPEHSAGDAVADGTSELYRYEWGGGIAAALGTFLTPVITAIPVAYCLYKIYPENKSASFAIMAVYLMTCLIWFVFLVS
jgi:hypothetical protein